MLKLQDNEITQHIHDLADNNDGQLNRDFGEDCVKRFIKTFADNDMREEYEGLWNQNNHWYVESPGCPENCRCRN